MDSTSHLRSFLHQAMGFTERDVSFFESTLTLRSLRKGERFLVPGEICAVIGIVTRGCLRVYFNEPAGIERVLYFAPEGWCVTDHESLASQRPGVVGIDALETTEVWVADRATFSKAPLTRPSRDGVWSVLAEQALRILQQRLVSALRKTAAQRYLEFRKVYPGLDARISQYHVAAYLGVSPEFLSKLRTRLIRDGYRLAPGATE
jgi:CRP/FNR family cyclic AMP-dependent transcriptional regulator